MALKMHRSVVSYSGYYKDTVNYSVSCGERYIAYIYENSRAPEGLRWFWALHVPRMPVSNQAATLEEAKAEFEASWKQWKAWRVGGGVVGGPGDGREQRFKATYAL
jgi:hypothetical protein